MKRKVRKGAKRLGAVLLSVAMLMTSISVDGLVVHAEEDIEETETEASESDEENQEEEKESEESSEDKKSSDEAEENEDDKNSDDENEDESNDKSVDADEEESSEETTEEVTDTEEETSEEESSEEETTEDSESVLLNEDDKEEVNGYFIDCGYADEKLDKKSKRFEAATEDKIYLNDTADQYFDEEDGWGVVKSSIDGSKGYEDTLAGTGHETGYYGNKDTRNVTYKITLDKGSYELTSGHYEWWNTSARKTEVIVSYDDYEVTLGEVSFTGTKGAKGEISGSFYVDEDDTLVTVTFAKAAGSVEAGVVSYFTVEETEEADYILDKTEYPSYVEKDLSNLPEEIVVSNGEDEKTIPVIWKVSEGDSDIIGTEITLEPDVEGDISVKGFDAGKIKVTLPVSSSKMVYFVDAGLYAITDANKQEHAEEIKELEELGKSIMSASEKLLNEKLDQEFTGDATWGYVKEGINVKGFSKGRGLHATGFYGANDGSVNPAYHVTLDKGNYELTTGHTEWWSNTRDFDVVVTVDGKDTTVGSTSITKGDTKYVNGTFSVEKDKSDVIITVKRTANDAAALSYFAIEDTDAKADDVTETTLVAHYDFDDMSGNYKSGTTVKDATDNGNDAKIKGNGASVTRGALFLPGGANNSNAAYVEIPSDVFDNKETITISAMIQNSFGSGNTAAMFYGTDNVNPTHYWLLNPANPQGYFKSVYTNGTSTNNQPWSTETAISSKKTTAEFGLYTTVITKDSIKGYYNGKLVSESAKSLAISDFTKDLSGVGTVAYIGKSSYPDAFWKGQIKDVRIYEGALTDEEIEELYEENVEADYEYPAYEATATKVEIEGVEDGQVVVGQDGKLPTKAKITYSDGTTSTGYVTWDKDITTLDKGVYDITGTVDYFPYPLVEERADPYAVYDEETEKYFFCASWPAYGSKDKGYDRIALRIADSISDLADAEDVTIWEKNASTCHVWAPELHKIDGEWYVYYAASYSGDWAIRPYVLHYTGKDAKELDSVEQFIEEFSKKSNWEELGQVTYEDGSKANTFSLDMTYFEVEEQGYVIWADKPTSSNLMIAKVDREEPYKLASEAIRLSLPDYEWEVQDGELVNEGAAVLQKDGKIYVTFSASATGDNYCVGLLEADADDDLLDTNSWYKYPVPVLTSEDADGEYGPGHNSFTVDENGNVVMIYHARDEECHNKKCGYSNVSSLYDPCRNALAKYVRFDEDGQPIFSSNAQKELGDLNKVTVKVNVGDLTDLEQLIYGIEPMYADDFEDYEEGASAEKDNTLTSTNGDKSVKVENDKFVVEKEEDNQYLRAEKLNSSSPSVAEGQLCPETVKYDEDVLVMMDAVIPTVSENEKRAYAQIKLGNDYFKFGTSNGVTGICQGYNTKVASYTFKDGDKVNLAVMLMDGQYTFFIDGKKIATCNATQNKVDRVVVSVGTGAGMIDNVAIYKAADIKMNMNKDALSRLQADLDAIMIPNLDNVRGNITLPTVGSEYESIITWKTSDEDVITTTGEVTRQSEDTEVVLTATLTDKQDANVTLTKEFNANVIQKVGELDYSAYLFAYFTGESSSDGEQIYFATSKDGLNWQAMNTGKPVLTSELGEKGLRDPFIMRSPEGDRFYLIATDLRIYNGNGWTAAQNNGSRSIMVWESTDLVNWSDQRMVEVAVDGAGCTWAPEAFYNDETGEYIVFWASRVPSLDNTQRVYYATTRDFYTFSDAKLWIELHNDKNETISVIDSTVIKVGDTYYRFSKDEASSAHKSGSDYNSAGKYIFVEKSKDLLGDWEEIPSNITKITGQEGPTCFKFNDEEKWCLLLDNFGGVGYHPLVTTDMSAGEFTELAAEDYSFPSTMRHGSVLNLTAEEYEAIQLKWNPDYLKGDYSFVVDGSKANKNEADAFIGIGAVSANNSSRLLMDYKTQNPDAYWEIMDTLFNKEKGAGLSHVKVELGSDVNSSSGTEPASMRSEDEAADVTRGAGWMFAADAKKVNPDVEIDALRWAAPAWVGNDYAKRYKWYIETIKAVYDEYGLELDYISADQNETEKNKIDRDWIVYLSKHLKEESTSGYYDFSKIKIVASDELQTYGLGAMMLEDEELRDAVDAIGIHYTTKADSNMLKLNDEYGKQIFYSEGVSPTTPADESAFYDGSGLTGTNGALDVANRFINSYYNGSMVLYEYQPSVAAYYEGAKYFPKQIMTANTPWSGYYKTDIGVWTTAHFMQFIDKGWQYVDEACFGDGTENQTIKPGSSTNNYLTLTDPETGDYTIVATNDSKKTREYKVRIANLAKAGAALKMIESIGPDSEDAYDANWFKCIGEKKPVDNGDGTYTVEFEVRPYSILTLTTLTDRGPKKGESGITQCTGKDTVLDNSEETGYIYSDDFDYEDKWLAGRGDAPLYTTDQGGAFEVVKKADGNKVLQQKITADIKPTDWRYRTTPNPHTLLGDDRWANYTVSVDVKLDASNKTTANYAGVGGRHITTNNDDSKISSGYQFYIYADGTWSLVDVTKTVNSGKIADFDISKTYNLALECKENRIIAYIDGERVAAYTDSEAVTATGKVTLMSGYFKTEYDNLKVKGLEGHAYTAIKRIDNFSYDLNYAGNWSHTTNAGYGYYGRTYTTGKAGSEADVSFSNTGSEGQVNAYYYYKANGSTWSSNSSNAWAGEAGSYYSVTFNGTGISLKAVCNGSNGTGTVYLDGEKHGSLSCNASSQTTAVVYTVTDLDYGKHTIKVVVDKDGSYVSAAGAVVYGSISDDTSLSFDFTGTGFNVVGSDSSGAYDIYIDNEKVETVAATNVGNRQASIMVRNLKDGAHTARVVIAGGSLKVDAVEIMGAIDGEPEDMLDDYELADALFNLQQAVKSYTLTDEEKETYSKASLEKFEEAYDYANRVANENWGDMTDIERINSYYNKLVAKYNGLVKKGTGDTLAEPVTYKSFTGTNGDTWYDTDGTEIQAHGGQVLPVKENGKTVYYWYGEDKTNGDYRVVDGGVRVYSSTDLYNWKNEGRALHDVSDKYDFEEDYFKELYGEGCEIPEEYDGDLEKYQTAVLLGINDTTSVMERPKVIYNEKTGKYVMWFHADGPTETSNSNYAAASAGLAISDSPVGPFKYIGRYRLHYINGAYDSNKGMARDMNLFVDDDKTAYIIYSSEENATMFISKLNDEYTGLAVDADEAAKHYDETGEMSGFNRIPCYASGNTISGIYKREAPAMFKYNGRYYLMTSGCTGWGANEARYAVCDGDSPLDTGWKDMGDPCVTDTSVCKYTISTTFGTQSTNILEVNRDKAEFIYMGDRWNNDSPAVNELVDPKYVWLPVQFTTNGEMVIYPKNDWTLDDLGVISYSVEVTTQLPETVTVGKLDTLPETVTVNYADQSYETKVTWTVEAGDITKAGSVVTVKGKLVDFKEGKTIIQAEMLVVSEQLVYLVDCGAGDSSASYELAAKVAELKNEKADADYSETSGWGLDRNTIDGQKSYSTEFGRMLESGYYGKNDGSKNVTYYVTLDAGTYDLTAGMTEWWNNKRNTDVVVSYKNSDGTAYAKNLGTVVIDGTKGLRKEGYGTFEVAEDNTLVTVTFAKSGSGDAGVIAYFAIANAYVAPEEPGTDEPGTDEPGTDKPGTDSGNKDSKGKHSHSSRKSSASATSNTVEITDSEVALASSPSQSAQVVNEAQAAELQVYLTGIGMNILVENIYAVTSDNAVILKDGSAITADHVLILVPGTAVLADGSITTETGIVLGQVMEGTTIITSEWRAYVFHIADQKVIANEDWIPGKTTDTITGGYRNPVTGEYVEASATYTEAELAAGEVLTFSALNQEIGIQQTEAERIQTVADAMAGKKNSKTGILTMISSNWYWMMLVAFAGIAVTIFAKRKNGEK